MRISDWSSDVCSSDLRERAFAIGIFSAGPNVGAIITPLLVPVLVLAFDWRVAFYVTGLLGVAWPDAWWILYHHPRRHPPVTPSHNAWIDPDHPFPLTPIPVGQLNTDSEPNVDAL